MQNVRFPTTPPINEAQEQLNFQIEALLPDTFDLGGTTYNNMMWEIGAEGGLNDCRAFSFAADGLVDCHHHYIEFWCFEERVEIWSNNQQLNTVRWGDLANNMIPEISENPIKDALEDHTVWDGETYFEISEISDEPNERFPTTPPINDAWEQLNFQIEALLDYEYTWGNVKYTFVEEVPCDWGWCEVRALLYENCVGDRETVYCTLEVVRVYFKSGNALYADWETLDTDPFWHSFAPHEVLRRLPMNMLPFADYYNAIFEPQEVTPAQALQAIEALVDAYSAS